MGTEPAQRSVSAIGWGVNGSVIVTCERCATQFQLEDARVPEGGVRVRCSRCKHAFHVEPPARTELERIHRVASRALEEAEEGPDITQDLAPSSAVGPEREGLPSDDEESDWEFNDGGPAASGGEERGDAESVVDALLSGPGAGSTSAFEDSDFDRSVFQDDGDGGSLDLASDPAPVADPAEEASADGDAPQEPLLESPPSAAPAAAESPGIPLQEEPAPARERRGARAGEPEPETDELGSPREWDIFADAPPPEAAPAVAERTAPVAKPRPRVVERRVAGPEAEALDEGPAVGPWLRRLGSAAGWTVALALWGTGLALGLAPRAPVAASAPSGEVAGLRLDGVRARWIDNAVLGSIYVVSGRLHNPGPSVARSAPIVLVLRDASGDLVGDPIPLGRPVEPRVLREGDRDAIRADSARAGPPLPAELAPRDAVPFEAVVWPLPDTAERFDFEVSAPAAALDAPAGRDAASGDPGRAPEGLSSGAPPPSPPPSGE